MILSQKINHSLRKHDEHGKHVDGRWGPQPIQYAEDVLGNYRSSHSYGDGGKYISQGSLQAKVREIRSSSETGLIRDRRLIAASQGWETPAKPETRFTRAMATMMAISRELTYASFPLIRSKTFRWSSPILGRVFLVSAELLLVMVLCFYMMNPYDQWQWENIGYRTGFIALAQLPLIVLLAGKNNIIGFLIGSSYERLSWLHRWTARILFLTVTIHMGFWFLGWARYQYIMVKLKNDLITQRGFAAWCILLWIVLSSFAPIRRWNYEFFVIQHIVTLAGFLAAVYLHVPAEVQMWVWIPVGLAIFDRVVRALFLLYANISIFHPKREGFWACKATFEPLGSDMTRIVIKNPPVSWSVGQHVLLSCHSIAPLQSHPFTIASIPQDGKMEFLVKSKSGGTKRFFRHAQMHQELPLADVDSSTSHRAAVLIEGPYGKTRQLRQFDSIFLIAGSSGASFTVPLMRDIVASWETNDNRGSRKIFRRPGCAVTRYIRFVWVVKSRDQVAWFASQLVTVARDVEQLRADGCDVETDMSIYVTCSEDLSGDGTKSKEPALPAPQLRDKPEKQPRSLEFSAYKTEVVEKIGADHISVHSAPSGSDSKEELRITGGLSGSCCCTVTIENEADVSELDKSNQCRCGDREERHGSINSSNSSAKSSSPLDPEKPRCHSIPFDMKLLSGRPQPKNLVRKMLEQALGESAVVVCGPQGLVDDVRQSVVALSDERAVHKGSGAQGVYLHTEAFDY